jgi:hypothetical protein
MVRARNLLSLGTLIAAAAFGSTTHAASDAPIRVSLEIASCAELEAHEVEDLVRLSATVTTHDDAMAVAVEVSCTGEALLLTARRRSAGGRSLRRFVRIQEVGEVSRARLVSLAVTELATAFDHGGDACCGGPDRLSASPPQRVAAERAAPPRARIAAARIPAPQTGPAATASTGDDEGGARTAESNTPAAPSSRNRTEPRDPPPEQGSPPNPAPGPPAVKAEAQPESSERESDGDPHGDSTPAGVAIAVAAPRPRAATTSAVLLARGGAEDFFRGFGRTTGVGLRLSLDGARRIGLTVDAQGSTARVPVSAGSVTVSTVALAPSLHARIDGAGGRWDLRAGVGPKLGVAFLSGSPSAPPSEAAGSTFSAPWAGVSSFAALRARPVGPLVLELSAEGGVVLSPVSGLVDGRREVAVTGPWLALFAGAGLLL